LWVSSRPGARSRQPASRKKRTTFRGSRNEIKRAQVRGRRPGRCWSALEPAAWQLVSSSTSTRPAAHRVCKAKVGNNGIATQNRTSSWPSVAASAAPTPPCDHARAPRSPSGGCRLQVGLGPRGSSGQSLMYYQTHVRLRSGRPVEGWKMGPAKGGPAAREARAPREAATPRAVQRRCLSALRAGARARAAAER
jgi:hypothetical protein